MNDILILLIGVICAGLGGELFVRGTVGLAHWWRIPPGIIGATVAAFATSSPELSVSVSAALAERPHIALGDALGSNVVNVALILALVLAMSGLQGSRDSIKRDFPVALLVPVLTALLLFDHTLSRSDGILMLLAFVVWLVATVIEARKQRSAADEVLGAHRHGAILLSCGAGLGLLVAAGLLIVRGATGIALSLGLDTFVIGAMVVAIGTSTPELATVVIAKLRGHNEVSLGTILGSNIFNGLFIVAVAAVIHPIEVRPPDLAMTLAVGLLALVIAYPPASGFIDRRRGVLLLILYVFYVASLLQ